MKLTFLITAIFVGSSSLISASLFSKTYEGCADTKQEALYALSGNIQSRISTYIEQTVMVTNDDSVKSKVSDYASTATNLSLVNIEYKNKKNEVCAIVHKDDQVSNTNRLLKQVLLYDAQDLPADTDAKIQKLSAWISNIKQLSFLIPVFIDKKDTDKEQEILNQKEKTFIDLYTKSIAYSNSLFFKSCKSSQEKAKIALNKKLFLNEKKEKEKGFLDTFTSIFTSDDSTKMLDIFDAQIIEVKKDGDICLMIKKEELLHITQKIYTDAMRISEKGLSKNPLKRYKNINDNLYEQLDVAKALIKLYPDVYKSNHFNQLNEKRQLLVDVQAKTFPQYVQFNISGGDNISISIDNKPIKNNEKYYLKDGDHTYKIAAKGKCPLVDTFNSDIFENKIFSEDLSGQTYPTVIFQTDKEPNIIINGRVIKINMTQTIEKCEGEVRYVVKYASQNISGEIDTTPGAKSTVILNFLTAKELAIFNDAKTKKFTTTGEARFSETLTPSNSENLKFTITRNPMHGEVTLHESGSFQYISEENFVGVDNFEYEIRTPQKISAPKIVSITVEASLFPKTVALKELEKPENNLSKVITQEELPKTKAKKTDISYESFKTYVESKELTVELMKKIKEKFPEYFEKLRKEMTQ